MDVWQARPAESGAKQGMRLVAAAIVVLGLWGQPATAAVYDALALDRTPEAVRHAAAKSAEPDETRYQATDVLPWKLGAPKLSFEGYEHIITAASSSAKDSGTVMTLRSGTTIRSAYPPWRPLPIILPSGQNISRPRAQ